MANEAGNASSQPSTINHGRSGSVQAFTALYIIGTSTPAYVSAFCYFLLAAIHALSYDFSYIYFLMLQLAVSVFQLMVHLLKSES